MARVESQVHVTHRGETSRKNARDDEQGEGAGHLDEHQNVAKAAAAPGGGATAAALVQNRRDVGARRRQRGPESGAGTRQQRCRQGVGEHAPVETEIERRREAARYGDRGDGIAGPRSQSYAGHAAE